MSLSAPLQLAAGESSIIFLLWGKKDSGNLIVSTFSLLLM